MISNKSTTTDQPLPIAGLIALDRDIVIERDIHRLIGARVEVSTTRIPLGRVGSLEHLRLLADHVADAARLLKASSPSVVAFGCTSGIAAIGSDRVRGLIDQSGASVHVVDPLTAMVDGLTRLDVSRIGIATPYPAPIADLLGKWFTSHGFQVVANTRVQKSAGQHYADIEPDAIRDALTMADAASPEAFIVACTDLRTIELIESLESELGRPVATSNQALARAMAGSVGASIAGPGAIFTN